MSGQVAGKAALSSGVVSSLNEPQEHLSAQHGARALTGDLSSDFLRKMAAAILDTGDEAQR